MTDDSDFVEDFDPKRPMIVRGRSSHSNTVGRFECLLTERFDDGWTQADEDSESSINITLTADTAKSIISRNDSPDLGFDRSGNPPIDFWPRTVYLSIDRRRRFR